MGKDQLNRAQVTSIFQLIQKHEWLMNKHVQLLDLLLEDCQTDLDRKLITDLLDRFTYIKAEELSIYLDDLFLDIVTTPNITAQNTVIAAMAADSSPDSSQFLVHQIKCKFQTHGWQDIAIVNTFGAAFKKSKESGYVRTNIILVDEFLGSGKTALSRVQGITSTFKEKAININVYVKVILSSIVGEEFLTNNGVQFNSIKSIKRGISDFESQNQAKSKIDLMLALESQLYPKVGTHLLDQCSLGYGKTESLFSINDGNISNNVFPVFWWPKKLDGKDRKTLFTRFVG